MIRDLEKSIATLNIVLIRPHSDAAVSEAVMAISNKAKEIREFLEKESSKFAHVRPEEELDFEDSEFAYYSGVGDSRADFAREILG